MNRPARPKNLPANERRNVTVEAVIELAASISPDRITTAAIAEHMGVTQGAVFRHFPTRDAIWEAVMEWVAEHLMDRLGRAADGIDSPMSALQAIFLAHTDFVADHPGVPRLLYGELQRARLTPVKRVALAMMQNYADRLLNLLEAGVARGELNPALDVNAATTLFVGTIQGLVMQGLMIGDLDRMRAHAPRVFAIYQRGIEAAGGHNKGD